MRWDSQDIPKPDASVQTALGYSLLAAPLLTATYALLVAAGLIGNDASVGATELLVLVASWLLSTWVLIRHSDTPRARSAALIIYSLLFYAVIVVTGGDSSPVAVLWLPLALATYALGSAHAYVFSMIGLLVAALTPTALSTGLPPTGVTLHYLGLVLASVGVIYVASLVRMQRTPMRQQIASGDNQLSTIINNLTSAIISTDPDGKITVFNAASLGLLDTNADIQDMFVDDVIDLQDDTGANVSLYALLKDLQLVQTYDTYFMILDNDRIQLEITMSPIKNSYSSSQAPTTTGYVLIARDITHEKSLEQEKDEFISVVSHELRTPIAIAEGTISNAQVLLKRSRAKSSKKIGESVNLAHDQVMFLAKMVNDLSTLSRAERGFGDESTVIDFRELVQAMYNEYEPQARERKLTMDLDTTSKSVFVKTSDLYLRELMQNFITNALKYTKEGSITLSLTEKGNTVVFAVKDTGIGMTTSDQQHIYEKFFRSEDYRTRETGGTGLGLYVAKKLADKIGTTIELKSRLNHGSTFSIALPIHDDTPTS